ncbi:zinc ABC transporter substrate-binding protein [Deinococcus sp. KNUC1210]|uniref:metal ABC transporter solute-binding protein, Zn/Mn family n=1 Tax=Deinococcus sp. KNUC1210 TaxID=2917691 RepID=UPI001EF1421B|nr:zinc ABC transporter substrate-binding protein [Deinococcus sp. KNUC1210]ULH16440.1 zinc ABC transporter substrate-binding protein [Deinococcus sp. KNUC1210]
MKNRYQIFLATLGLGALSAGLAAPLPVAASTSVIADFVKAVGGTRISVVTVVPANADTHTYQPATGDVKKLSLARALFINGANLEPWLPRLQGAVSGVNVVTLSRSVKLRQAAELQQEGLSAEGAFDPHAWWNPLNAAAYVKTIQAELTRLDPAGKTVYATNAGAYTRKLLALDSSARRQIATIPAAQRQLVTNHDALGYLAARYGLTVVGQVIGGLSTEREPSAQELATLVRRVRAAHVRAIFTENTVNARLAQALSDETGVKIAPPLYTDALGAPGSDGDSYLKAFQHDIDVIVKALK